MGSGTNMKIRSVGRRSVALAVLASLMFLGGQSVVAQEEIGPLSCDFYETYDEAQMAFDQGLKDNSIQELDRDGDGVVCEDTFQVGDGEQVQDFASCVTFANQDDAQVYLDGTPTDEEVQALDADGNGIACEDEFAEDDAPVDEEVAETPASSDEVVELPATGSGGNTAGFNLMVLVSGFAAAAMMGASLFIRTSGQPR